MLLFIPHLSTWLKTCVIWANNCLDTHKSKYVCVLRGQRPDQFNNQTLNLFFFSAGGGGGRGGTPFIVTKRNTCISLYLKTIEKIVSEICAVTTVLEATALLAVRCELQVVHFRLACRVKARLHRRFLSQQLNANFCRAKVATSKSQV